MLIKSPNHHLNDSDDQENEAARVTTLYAKDYPGEDFPPIVCAGEPLETPGVRDATFLGARLPQVAKVQVAHEVEELKEHEEESSSVNEFL